MSQTNFPDYTPDIIPQTLRQNDEGQWVIELWPKEARELVAQGQGKTMITQIDSETGHVLVTKKNLTGREIRVGESQTQVVAREHCPHCNDIARVRLSSSDLRKGKSERSKCSNRLYRNLGSSFLERLSRSQLHRWPRLLRYNRHVTTRPHLSQRNIG